MIVDFKKIIREALVELLPGIIKGVLQNEATPEMFTEKLPVGGSTPSPTPAPTMVDITPVTREQVGAALIAAAKEKGRDPIAAILKNFSPASGTLDGVPAAQYGDLLKAITDARAT